jgi:hypothetical protein
MRCLYLNTPRVREFRKKVDGANRRAEKHPIRPVKAF